MFRSVTILGGGFLGSELACAFGQRAKAGILGIQSNKIYSSSYSWPKKLYCFSGDDNNKMPIEVTTRGSKKFVNSLFRSKND